MYYKTNILVLIVTPHHHDINYRTTIITIIHAHSYRERNNINTTILNIPIDKQGTEAVRGTVYMLL